MIKRVCNGCGQDAKHYVVVTTCYVTQPKNDGKWVPLESDKMTIGDLCEECEKDIHEFISEEVAPSPAKLKKVS